MKLRYILVGAGRIGNRHASHMANYGEIIAVCDTDHTKITALAEKFDFKAFESVDRLIESKIDADVAVVCTPNGLHAEHSIKLLNSGYHVLCEKPMALTSHDCGKMIMAAESNNRRLFVIKQNRFNPPITLLKDLLEEKKLGTLFSFQLNCFWNRNNEYYKDSWKGTKSLDGGTLFTQFSHFVDLLYWLFGDLQSVKSYMHNYNHEGVTEFEDTGVVILKLLNGMIGSINFTTNASQKNMEGSLSVFGSKGTIKIGGQYLNEIEYFMVEGMEQPEIAKGNKPNEYGSYVGSMSNHHLVYQNMVEVLTSNQSISTSHFEGLKTVEFIEKIYGSKK